MTEAQAPRRSAARLTRLSFADGARAVEVLSGPALSWWDEGPVDADAAAVVAALGRTADPDTALAALAELVGADPALRDELTANRALRGRLLPLLAVSAPLTDHLVTHPHAWQVLLGEYDLPGAAARLVAAAE